jgi:uncharacterized membrane protein
MNPVLVFFALAAIVLTATILVDRIALLKRIGTAALSILIALVLSNLGVIPGVSPVYDFLVGQGVLAGIVLVLLNVNLTTVRDAGTPMIVAFVIACVASMVGTVIMASILHSSIGSETWKLAGQFTATYIGGGMNFAAVGRELGTRSDLFSAGIAADVMVTAFWLVACLTIPEFFSRRRGPVETPRAQAAVAADESRPALDILLGSSGRPMTLTDFAGLATITFGTMAVAELLTTVWPVMPRVLWITTIALVLAQVPLVRKFSGGVVIGNFLMLLFLASNGAKSVVSLIVEVGPAVFFFAAGNVAIHGIIIFGLGLALRIDPDVLSIASQSTVGGPTTAMALAGSRRRSDLILPGVISGLMGYALGNYAGIAIAHVVRGIVGG